MSDRSKPEDWPGARVLRANLRPDSHAPADVARALAKWLGELDARGSNPSGRGCRYFVKHLVMSVDTRGGVPKGRRYSARAVLWPRPGELHANSTRE